MGNQKLSPKRPLEVEIKPADPLEVTKTVEPPPIDDTVAKAQQALSLQITERKSRCRECKLPYCNHYKREYLDTLEPFDSSDPKYRDANQA